MPLLATQILWINLLTDSALALALGVDPAVEDVMNVPPRRITDRIVDRSMITTIALIGVTTAVVGLIALDLELAGGLLGGSGDIDTARTMVFTTIVLAQIFNAFNARSDTVSAFVRPFDNRLLWAAAGLTVVLQVAVVHAPATATRLRHRAARHHPVGDLCRPRLGGVVGRRDPQGRPPPLTVS